MLTYHEPQLGARLLVGPFEEAFPPESHQPIPYYTILLCHDGACCVNIDARRMDLGGVSALTLSPGTLLETVAVQPETVSCVQFNREFYCVEYHDAEVSCNGLLFNGASQPPVIRVPETEREAISLVIDTLESEFRNADRLQLEMLRVLLKRLIITCARLVKEQLESNYHLAMEDTDLLRSFSALVDKHFRSKHRVTDYAEMLNRSPKTLSNLFVRYSDRSALQVIHERIVIEAQRLLISTERSAKEIAFELGFCDPAQFMRFFKRMTGRTTQEWRAAQRSVIPALSRE